MAMAVVVENPAVQQPQSQPAVVTAGAPAAPASGQVAVAVSAQPPAPPQGQSAPRAMKVQVPEGAGPGSVLMVNSPAGDSVKVRVGDRSDMEEWEGRGGGERGREGGLLGCIHRVCVPVSWNCLYCT